MSITGCSILDKAGIGQSDWKKGEGICLTCKEPRCFLDRNMKITEKTVQCQKCLDIETLTLVNGNFVSQGKYWFENGQIIHKSKDKICGICKVIK